MDFIFQSRYTDKSLLVHISLFLLIFGYGCFSEILYQAFEMSFIIMLQPSAI